MRISVAMATWNGERFIAEQLESIAQQSRLPDELVICDDASTDATIDIAEHFARRAPFSVVIRRNDSRIGCAENFFRAMKLCTGDLIALCDQDDVWRPVKLARCERPFESDGHLALVAHSVRVVDVSLRPGRQATPRIWRRRVVPAGSLPPFSIVRGGCTLMFRSLFVVGGNVDDRPPHFFAPGVPMSHDVWVSLVCGALGTVALLPDSLAFYRRHDSNTTSSYGDTRARRLKRSLALRDEEAHFRGIGAAARELAAYLETLDCLADDLGEAADAGLERAITSHRRYANAMERRARAYAESRAPVRASRIAHHALCGDYAPRSNGGLGFPSLVRDFGVGLSRFPRNL